MSDSKSNETTSKGPSHIAYQVRDREGKKGFWTRIGSVWPHRSGVGGRRVGSAWSVDHRQDL